MAKIVILGAGLSGLSAAYHLEKRGFFDYQLFEKEANVGGLCRTIYQDGFTFDFTGHLLHTSDSYFRSLIEQVVGLSNLNVISRKSFIYSQNVYTNYPYQTNLFGLPEETIIDCIEGYITRTKRKKNNKTFIQWAHAQFGSGFVKHFFLPFEQKKFAYDMNKVTASWTGRFVPSTSLRQIIRGAISHNTEPVGYNANFLYPKHGGIFYWVHLFAQQIKKKIACNSCVKTIDLDNKVITFSNGNTQTYEQLINTIPLDIFLSCVKDKASTYFKRAQKKLLCNCVVNFNLGISRPDLSDKHWVYFPEEQYPFYRIGFPHNFSPHATPPECSSLYGEFAFLNKSSRWVNDTLKQALKQTKKLFKISKDQILTEKIITIPHAYVIFDAWRDKNIHLLLEKLKQESIHCIGRYGQWKYASMQEAVLDGKSIAQQLTLLPAKRTWYIPTTTRLKRKEKEQ